MSPARSSDVDSKTVLQTIANEIEDMMDSLDDHVTLEDVYESLRSLWKLALDADERTVS